jgi:ABC-2 type transport system ATP-binding protein
MLDINKLNITYGKVQAIKNISLKISKSGVYSFIGPNGAGKTSLLTCIAGLHIPSSGKILLDGFNPCLTETKSIIGFSSDEDSFFPADVSVRTMLEYSQEVKYGKQITLNKEIEFYLNRYDLISHADKCIGQCSFGMKKKLGICLALLGKPKYIVLDEPTNGIDTKAVIMLKEDIKRLAEDKSIMIISSHELDFLENVVNETFFIKNGTIAKTTLCSDELESIYRELYL